MSGKTLQPFANFVCPPSGAVQLAQSFVLWQELPTDAWKQANENQNNYFKLQVLKPK